MAFASASCSSSSLATLESETYVFTTGSSLESSKTFLDPLSEDKFALGSRVTKLGIEDGVTNNEEPSFIA